jgi:hypothetical protein
MLVMVYAVVNAAVTCSCEFPPEHTVGGVAVTEISDGTSFTVSADVAVPVQPLAAVPVTVYVVFDVGLAITVLPVVVFNPVAGDQLYVEAPLAITVDPAPPAQTDPLVGFAVTVGGVRIVAATSFVVTEIPLFTQVTTHT